MKTQLLPAQTYIFSTSLDKGENPRDPPKSPFKRGTKTNTLAPFLAPAPVPPF
jgi:hypothetical protein